MSNKLLCVRLALIPMICVGSISCSALKKGQVSYKEWREKREQRLSERKLARAEKAAGLTGEPRLADAQDPAIFLDYNNPNAATAAGTVAEGNRNAGFTVATQVADRELPTSVGELVNTVTTSGERLDVPIFHADSAFGDSHSSAPPDGGGLHPELVRAWAGSIAQVTGASLAEPLITAAMTASSGIPTIAAASAAPEPSSSRRSTAAAFAGQESVGLKTSEHEADWSTRQ